MLQLAVLLLVTGMMTWSQSQLTPKHKKCHQKTQGTCSRLPLLLNSEKTGDDKEVLYVDDNGDSWVPFVESGGFCNHIYKSDRRDIRDEDEQQLSRRILKIYSDLAMKRMELSGDKRSQELMGQLGIGPSILNSTETYMIMEELEGQVLTHGTLLSSTPVSIEVIRSVATTLAKLHSIPYISNGKQSKNMLWSCCDVFLSQIQENDDGLYRQYKEELSTQKQALDTLQLPLVLGHGDFKPSNVIILDESGEAKLVDWETCGCHFRAYDLAKFFRNTSPMTEQEHQQARKNRFSFLKHYCDRIEKGSCTPQSLWMESKLLLPMTWLEAALFFHCKSCSGEEEYEKLAEARLKGYRESLSDWQSDLVEYQLHMKKNPLR